MITGSLTIAIVPVGLAAIVPGLPVVLFLHESNHNISIHHQQTPSLGALAQRARALQVVNPPLQPAPLPPPVTAAPAAIAPPPHRTPHASLSRSVSTHPWHHQPHCLSLPESTRIFVNKERCDPVTLHNKNIASHTVRSQKRTNTYPSSQVGTQPSAGKLQTRTTTTPWPQDHATSSPPSACASERVSTTRAQRNNAIFRNMLGRKKTSKRLQTRAGV